MISDHLEMGRGTAAITLTPSAAEPATSAIRTVLLHIQKENLDTQIEFGLALARACSAHLSCVHATPIEAYTAFDSFGGVFVMNDVIRALDDEEADLKSRAEQELNGEDISWDYEQVTGSVGRIVAGRGALADLIVTGRSGHEGQFPGWAISSLADLLHLARTPIFIPGERQDSFDAGGTALIAWDGSFQAANAVRATIGLLKLASEVRVLQVEEQKEEAFPGTRLLEYLSRQGVHAELRVEPMRGKDHRTITAVLLSYAGAIGASYMVMGGYSHSRIGQFVFGGVTRDLLAGSPLSIILAR